MDEGKGISFRIPPVLFIASLLLGALSAPPTRDLIIQFYKTDSSNWPKLLIGLIAGGGIVIVAAGYLIGTVTHFLARSLFFIIAATRKLGKLEGSRFHESHLSDEAFHALWDRLRAPGG